MEVLHPLTYNYNKPADVFYFGISTPKVLLLFFIISLKVTCIIINSIIRGENKYEKHFAYRG